MTNEKMSNSQTTLRDLPVYKYTGEYARDHGELEQYRASGRANIACKEALEAAVNSHYRDNHLDTQTAVKEVVDQFGYERMLYVLAVTVKDKEWDGRISRGNKAWAQTMGVVENRDGLGFDCNVAFVVDRCHPGLTDLLVTAARREYAKEKDKIQDRSSVHTKLQQEHPHTAPHTTGKKKEQER